MDKYDEQIARITSAPDSLKSEWFSGEDLFQMAGDGRQTGCLTMIRKEKRWTSETPELTEAIRNDNRIPADADDITLADLPVFAEWQRRLDRELPSRQPPITTQPATV